MGAMVEGLVKVDDVPALKRKRTRAKYDEVVEFVSQDENSGEWFQLPETFANNQIAARLKKQYGDQGIVAVARQTEGDEEVRYNVFIAHNPTADQDADGE